MYLWNIHELKKILILNQLSEKYKFYYLFINMLLFAIFSNIYLFLPTDITIVDKINAGITIIVQSIGLILAYKINGGQQGKEFLTRCTSLYVSLSIRFLIFIVIPIALYVPFMWLLNFVVPNQYLGNISNAIDIVFVPIFEIIFFWRLIIHIRDVHNGQLKT